MKNKAFKKIYKNKYLIERVIENTLKIKSISNIILATTSSKKDLRFSNLKKKYDIKIFVDLQMILSKEQLNVL